MSDEPTMQWEWLGHFTVRLTLGGATVYVDPFEVHRRVLPADLVLITNPKLGHLSPEDIDRVSRGETLVAGPGDALAGLPGATRVLAPGDRLELGGFEVEAVPAYTVETEFFPRSSGWLGYVVRAGGLTLYHAGATDRIPEMDGIRAEVACLPASGRYLMGPGEARAAAEAVGARERVPLFLVGDRYEKLDGFVTGPGRASPRS